MATSERERWTNFCCPKCGSWFRYFGAKKYKMLMCSDRCHDKMYFEDEDGGFSG
jgi:hypothetical protein